MTTTTMIRETDDTTEAREAGETRRRPWRVDDMPLDRLRDRAADVRRILRAARSRAGTPFEQHAVDAALDRAERMLPGLMDRSRNAPLLALRSLAPVDRRALRAVLRRRTVRAAGETDGIAAPAPPRLPPALEGLSERDALEALERIDIQESLTHEVLRLLASFEAEHAVFASCC